MKARRGVGKVNGHVCFVGPCLSRSIRSCRSFRARPVRYDLESSTASSTSLSPSTGHSDGKVGCGESERSCLFCAACGCRNKTTGRRGDRNADETDTFAVCPWRPFGSSKQVSTPDVYLAKPPPRSRSRPLKLPRVTQGCLRPFECSSYRLSRRRLESEVSLSVCRRRHGFVFEEACGEGQGGMLHRCSCFGFGSCQAASVRREEDDPAEALAAKRRKVRASAVLLSEKAFAVSSRSVRSKPWNNVWSEPQPVWLQSVFVFLWASGRSMWSGLG